MLCDTKQKGEIGVGVVGVGFARHKNTAGVSGFTVRWSRVGGDVRPKCPRGWEVRTWTEIDHKGNREGRRGQVRDANIKTPINTHRGDIDKEFTLGRGRCPGRRTWECLERTGELGEPHQQMVSRSRNSPGSAVLQKNMAEPWGRLRRR